MATEKLYAGVKLRELRKSRGLTQKVFAAKLGISLPYLNQMERNHRPVSSQVVLKLAENFDLDVRQLSEGSAERLASDIKEVLADDVFTTHPPMEDLSLVAANAPNFARAFLELYQGWRYTHEKMATLNEALGQSDLGLAVNPWEEVRDFFHYRDNYIDEIDRAAEAFIDAKARGQSARMAALSRLGNRGFTVQQADQATVRSLDLEAKKLILSRQASQETQDFQMLVSVAELCFRDEIDQALEGANLQSEVAKSIAAIGLANYFAGAAMMPYGRFLEDAEAERHDLERLAIRYDASIEQVAHRLSTLQRPGMRGVPFFFVRVDQAGTITKRHSATKLQFARFGGACPLWNVHRAFETPGQFLRQLAETPDGVRYLCLARDVSKPGGSFGAPVRRYAIGLGCEVTYAPRLVYADTLDIKNQGAFEPIGTSCRICPRQNCHQRAVPPLGRDLSIDPLKRDTLPYKVI